MKTLRDLQKEISAVNEKSGFHEYDDFDSDQVRSLYIGNKLMLVASELAEAQDEIRLGKDPADRYYNADNPNKPEGFPSEIADAVIRLLDMADELGIDLQDVIEEKVAFNATRPFKHGKQF